MVGYRWSPEQVPSVPDPEQRDLVREIFRLVVEERMTPWPSADTSRHGA